MNKEEKFELARLCSIQDEEARRIHELEMMRGAGHSGHAAAVQESARLVEGGQS